MIQFSDNDSATALFHAVGGADGINAFLAPIPHTNRTCTRWFLGFVRASSVQVGVLPGTPLRRRGTRRLADLALFRPSRQRYRGAVLGSGRSWGWECGRLRSISRMAGCPVDEGWVVNSVGLLKSTDRTYVVVFMSDRQPDFEAAVHGIEAVVALIRAPLFGPSPTPASEAAFASLRCQHRILQRLQP